MHESCDQGDWNQQGQKEEDELEGADAEHVPTLLRLPRAAKRPAKPQGVA